MKYFFHLRNDVDAVLDTEGRGFATEDDMRAATLDAARDILASDLRGGTIDLNQRIDVVDERGAVVHSLDFRDAVRVTGLRN